jgi:DHA1 family multidrug resistance protein-like MFS transporter
MPRDLLLVAFSLLFWGIGEGMFVYFQPIYLQQFGADPVMIGGIFSVMGISMTVAQAPAGYLADRIGSRPVMWASWVFGTLAATVMAVASTLPFFVVGMLMYGLTSFVMAPLNTYLTSSRGAWSVERAITVPSALFNLGMVIGPIIGGLIAEEAGIRQIYTFSAIIFTISTIIILFARRAQIDAHHEATIQRPNLLHNPRFQSLLVLIALTTFALYLPQPLTPNFLQNEGGLSLSTIGQLGSVGSLGNTIIVLGLGHLRAPVGFLAGQILMGLFALLMWQGQSMPWFAIGYFFIGGFRLTRAMALAFARKYIRAAETGFAFGLIETANGFAVILAPLLAGNLYKANPRSMYAVSFGLIVILVLANLGIRLRLSRGKTAPETDEG